MTSQGMNAEIEMLRLQQADHRKHWRRFGLASHAVAVALCIVVLIRMAATGGDPPSPMVFIVLTYLYLGFAFTAAARPRAFRWLPRR